MGVYFKQNDFFVEYCTAEGGQLNCNERDELFNSIFTTASISFGVGAFLFGLLSDRLGIFVGRLTSFSFVSIGLTILVLILKRIIPENPWIWIAWPCLTMGGMANHTLNIRFCRSAPPIASFLMALTSGCLVAGGSLVLMFQRISEGTGTSFPDVFVILIICYVVNSIITITIFTPHIIPSDGVNLIKESVVLNLFRKKNHSPVENLHSEKELDQSSSEDTSGSMLEIFKNANIWLTLLASCAWELRRNTHQGWLAAGWPQWVAAGDENIEDGDQFDYDINRFQSIAFFCLIGGNLIPGILIDSMNKRITRPNDPNYGRAVAILILSCVNALSYTSQSLFQAFPNEICAYAGVILHTLGRMSSVYFNPMYFILFPPRYYGLVYGIGTLGPLPFQYLSIPMLNYIKANDDDFATMNFIIAGLSMMIFFNTLAVYLNIRKINKENKIEISAEETQRKSDFETSEF